MMRRVWVSAAALVLFCASGSTGGHSLEPALKSDQGRGGRVAGPPTEQTGTGLIVGQVIDAATGKPIPGAIVSIGGGSGRGALRGGGPGAGARGAERVVVDPRGRFLFRNLQPAHSSCQRPNPATSAADPTSARRQGRRARSSSSTANGSAT
jgi:hypothetical protein